MTAQHDSTKHALKAIADSLQGEINRHGVRVLRDGGTRYQPELLLQPDDVASVVINAVSLPRTVEVTDVSIWPMIKS